MQTIVTPDHPNAQATYEPSRDMTKTFGLGTARRQDPNMLASRKNVAISLSGFTQPKWGQSRAIENKGGVLPNSKPVDVIARSGNQTNLAQIGLADDNTAQVSQAQPAPTFDLSLKNPMVKYAAIGFGTYLLITKFLAPKLFGGR